LLRRKFRNAGEGADYWLLRVNINQKRHPFIAVLRYKGAIAITTSVIKRINRFIWIKHKKCTPH
jgi:hypothetical protein